MDESKPRRRFRIKAEMPEVEIRGVEIAVKRPLRLDSLFTQPW